MRKKIPICQLRLRRCCIWKSDKLFPNCFLATTSRNGLLIKLEKKNMPAKTLSKMAGFNLINTSFWNCQLIPPIIRIKIALQVANGSNLFSLIRYQRTSKIAKIMATIKPASNP